MSAPDSFFTATLKSKLDLGEPRSTGTFGVAVSFAARGSVSLMEIGKEDLASSPSAWMVIL